MMEDEIKFLQGMKKQVLLYSEKDEPINYGFLYFIAEKMSLVGMPLMGMPSLASMPGVPDDYRVKLNINQLVLVSKSANGVFDNLFVAKGNALVKTIVMFNSIEATYPNALEKVEVRKNVVAYRVIKEIDVFVNILKMK
jgi:hypothetical protein